MYSKSKLFPTISSCRDSTLGYLIRGRSHTRLFLYPTGHVRYHSTFWTQHRYQSASKASVGAADSNPFTDTPYQPLHPPPYLRSMEFNALQSGTPGIYPQAPNSLPQLQYDSRVPPQTPPAYGTQYASLGEKTRGSLSLGRVTKIRLPLGRGCEEMGTFLERMGGCIDKDRRTLGF